MLPDAEALVLAWLRTRPELVGVTFGTTRPADLVARLPFVLVERIGGGPSAPSWRAGALVDRAGIALQGWAGPHRVDARRLVHSVIHSLSTTRAAAVGDGVIVRVVVLAGPTPLPDPAASEDAHRFTATAQVTTRARTPTEVTP